MSSTPPGRGAVVPVKDDEHLNNDSSFFCQFQEYEKNDGVTFARLDSSSMNFKKEGG
jgi:hypothetical protein